MSERYEVHRDDGELVGFVRPIDGVWAAETVFGYELERFDECEDARMLVESSGLAYLADRWLVSSEGDVAVEIVEASPARVTVRIVDFGAPDRYGERITLSAPVGTALRRSS